LHLTGGITEEFLQALTFGRPARALCPRLEVITFRCYIAAGDSILSDMILSRWHLPRYMIPGASRLKQIDIVLSKDTHARDVRRLRECLDEGLGGQVHADKQSTLFHV